MDADSYLVIVSCGRQKVWERNPQTGPSRAADAYTSPVFRASRRYAETFATRWVILSAKYGFINPDFVIPANYNVSFYDQTAIPNTQLTTQVLEAELFRFKDAGVLGSTEYWTRVRGAFSPTSVQLHHINGNIGFHPLFLRLVGELIRAGTPIPVEDV
jgi:hypothetical protein